MKFKKFLALSLAAAMMTTGIPGVGMLDGAVNVMAAEDIGDADADAASGNNVTFKKADGSTVNITVEYYDDASIPAATTSSVTYTGKDQKPSLKNTKVCITDDDSSVVSTLIPNTDYTVAYYKVAKDGNIEVPGEKVTSIVDAGDYFITYTGKGNYSGTIYGKFTVKPIDFSAGTNNQNIYITTSKAGYTGKEISPTVSKIEY